MRTRVKQNSADAPLADCLVSKGILHQPSATKAPESEAATVNYGFDHFEFTSSGTRDGLMTRRYAWRTRLQSGVLSGGESLIDEDRLTLAKLFRRHGYHTAGIGKWHLGMLFDGEHRKGDVQPGATRQSAVRRGGCRAQRGRSDGLL